MLLVVVGTASLAVVDIVAPSTTKLRLEANAFGTAFNVHRRQRQRAVLGWFSRGDGVFRTGALLRRRTACIDGGDRGPCLRVVFGGRVARADRRHGHGRRVGDGSRDWILGSGAAGQRSARIAADVGSGGFDDAKCFLPKGATRRVNLVGADQQSKR